MIQNYSGCDFIPNIIFRVTYNWILLSKVIWDNRHENAEGIMWEVLWRRLNLTVLQYKRKLSSPYPHSPTEIFAPNQQFVLRISTNSLAQNNEILGNENTKEYISPVGQNVRVFTNGSSPELGFWHWTLCSK